MSVKLEPLAKVGSIGLEAVTDHIDPKALVEKLDPRPLVEKIEKIDARAVAERLDPRPLVEKIDTKALVDKLDPRSHPQPPKRRGRKLTVLAIALLTGGAVAFWVSRKRRSNPANVGRDTATGTDPNAKYERPGYEDKSLGQAVNADMDLADSLVAQEHGDMARAEQRFAQESAGAPALRRQATGGA
jgi:hypothetical protein